MKRKQWNITADVYIRFNLNKLKEEHMVGRTSKSLDLNKKSFLRLKILIMVGDTGFEPVTSAMSMQRSSQLS